MLPPLICLMGPTASGKTDLAVEMVQKFPCEIISVDSAQIYQGMDIGTAKPTPAILEKAPHRLINFLDPKESYSAGQFRHSALQEIDEILAQGKVPLLVGGTMLYFRVLQHGLARLPRADQALRTSLQARAEQEGWQALHRELACVDALAASRIAVNDTQRIQRALEVYMLTGKKISECQKTETQPLAKYRILNLIIAPNDRALLHQRIEERFKRMLSMGFVEEVEHLYQRGDLCNTLPSIRSVGYRQVWDYLDGHTTYDTMVEKGIVATRQLAKRQLTWLRAWQNALWFHQANDEIFNAIAHHVTIA